MITAMNITHELITHFKTKPLAAKALGVSMETLRLWGKNGIPPVRALKIEKLTRGKFTADAIIREARRRK